MTGDSGATFGGARDATETLFDARNHAFGWARRWTNAGGDPMVTVPASAFDELTAVADDALALLAQHISDEQRKELGRRIVDRLTRLGRPT